MEITPERSAQMQAAADSMRKKINYIVHDDNRVTIIHMWHRLTLTRDEFGEMVDMFMQLDFQMDDAA